MTENLDRGSHPILSKDHPFTFIDSCVYIWPDADFDNAHRHGVTAYTVTAFMPYPTVEKALEGVMYWHLVDRQHENITIAYNAEDIRLAKREKKAALVLATQDGDFLGRKLHRIEAFYRLGLRILIPAYNANNSLADGCLDRTECGLTRLGEKVVDECNRVGMLLDCSHVGRRGSLEIIERSTYPVVFSHSNVKAIVDRPRNIDDVQIKACAAKGGVIGTSPWGPMVFKLGGTQRPTIDDFIDHIDYIAQLLGTTDNIGIGTDNSLGTFPKLSGDPWVNIDYKSPVTKDYEELFTSNPRSTLRSVKGFSNYAQVMDLIGKLGQRGYSEADVRNILGENYLRVFKEVWK
jgi:membrane dipeptidase